MQKRSLLITATLAVASCAFTLSTLRAEDAPATQPAAKEVTTASGLKILDTKAPDATAKAGDRVWVHYIGKLENGTEFDNSYKRGEPLEFNLGQGKVIKGFDEGLQGMQVGQKRTLTIPSDIGYGAAGAPPAIPANATLVFEVELVGLKR